MNKPGGGRGKRPEELTIGPVDPALPCERRLSNGDAAFDSGQSGYEYAIGYERAIGSFERHVGFDATVDHLGPGEASGDERDRQHGTGPEFARTND